MLMTGWAGRLATDIAAAVRSGEVTAAEVADLPLAGVIVHRSCKAAIRQSAELLAAMGHEVRDDDPAYRCGLPPR